MAPLVTFERISKRFGAFTAVDDLTLEINERELRRFISWLIEKGVHGLYPNGSTGEFTRFTEEERRRIIQIVADENRGRVRRSSGHSGVPRATCR